MSFTVKDFISYNNPCFSCGEKIIFTIGDFDPIIQNDICQVQLISTYNRSLFLTIHLKTNKFTTSDKKLFAIYQRYRPISLESFCSVCHSTIVSQTLNFSDPYILPTQILEESLYVRTVDTVYYVRTSNQTSNIKIYHPTKPLDYILELTSPHPLPRSSFPNRQAFIKKLKTYLIFS